MNCYNSQGFNSVGMERQPLKADNRPDTEFCLSTWVNNDKSKPSEKVIVAHWYEVGDYTMYERAGFVGHAMDDAGQEQMAGHVQSPAGDAGR